MGGLHPLCQNSEDSFPKAGGGKPPFLTCNFLILSFQFHLECLFGFHYSTFSTSLFGFHPSTVSTSQVRKGGLPPLFRCVVHIAQAQL